MIFWFQGHIKWGWSIVRVYPGALAPLSSSVMCWFGWWISWPSRSLVDSYGSMPLPVSWAPRYQGSSYPVSHPHPIPHRIHHRVLKSPAFLAALQNSCSLFSTLPSLQVEPLPRVNVVLRGGKEDGSIVGSDPLKYKLPLRQRGTKSPLHGKNKGVRMCKRDDSMSFQWNAGASPGTVLFDGSVSFFKILIFIHFIYLAVTGLSCSIQDL